jgi:hypothetical protein
MYISSFFAFGYILLTNGFFRRSSMPGYVSLYTAKAPPTADIFRTFPNIQDLQIMPAQIRFRLNQIQITINIMPAGQIPGHLDGLAGYVMDLHATNPRSYTPALLAKIRTIKSVLGCVIEPDWDEAGQVEQTLLRLNELQDGLAFANSTIFGPDNKPLMGPLAGD